LASTPEAEQDRYLIESLPPNEREQFIRDLQEVAAEEDNVIAKLRRRSGTAACGQGAERLSERAMADTSKRTLSSSRFPASEYGVQRFE
jgi:hypothetical protein